jgi:hypothetical protein
MKARKTNICQISVYYMCKYNIYLSIDKREDQIEDYGLN